MRKIVLVAVMGALLVFLTAGAASAATNIQCFGGLCFGTNGSDRIFESPGFDDIFAGKGRDQVNAGIFGGDVDRVNGGQGVDRINTADNDGLDTIICTNGDRVVADKGDAIKHRSACDRIRRF
jgi:hypothetical protein